MSFINSTQIHINPLPITQWGSPTLLRPAEDAAEVDHLLPPSSEKGYGRRRKTTSYEPTCSITAKAAGAMWLVMLAFSAVARAAASVGSITCGLTSSAAPSPHKKKTSSSTCILFLATGQNNFSIFLILKILLKLFNSTLTLTQMVSDCGAIAGKNG